MKSVLCTAVDVRIRLDTRVSHVGFQWARKGNDRYEVFTWGDRVILRRWSGGEALVRSASADLRAGVWHSLGVRTDLQGRIQVLFDGQTAITWRDPSPLLHASGVELCTIQDSTGSFDDVRIQGIPCTR